MAQGRLANRLVPAITLPGAVRLRKTGDPLLRTDDLFTDHEADLQEAAIDDIVESLLMALSKRGSMKFADVVDLLLQPYMLRETNVKDICVGLAKSAHIENTWGGGNRKPQDTDLILLSAAVND